MIRLAVPALLVSALTLGGCVQFPYSTTPREDMLPPQFQQLKDAEQLKREGRFSDAIKAYRKIIQEQPDSDFAATSRYNIALIYVDAANPEKDYAQAQAEFDAFIAQFPQHSRAPEAKSWRQVIKLAIDAKKESERLTKSIEQLKQLDVRQEEKRSGR